jgi:myo-inositol-1(or 4)-monophosphatase
LGKPDKQEAERKREDIERLRFAIDLAISSGNAAMRFYRTAQHAHTERHTGKANANKPLDQRKNRSTEADAAAHREILMKHMNGKYSREEMISEEGERSTIDLQGYTWVVDPLDGTGNFECGIPLFCTAIGGLLKGRPHLGVIFDPVGNEVYYATEGIPTQVWNISKGDVRPTRVDESITELRQSVLGIHISTREKEAERFVANGALFELSRRARQLRALGSSQLALMYVASGRLNGFMQLGMELWDQVAGIVLVQSAGGFVSDLRMPDDWIPSTKDIMAAGTKELRNELSKFWQDTSQESASVFERADVMQQPVASLAQ